MSIHPTAVIHPGAQLADGVVVEPYTIIGSSVRVGPGTRIGPHCVIEGRTTIGARCRLYAGVVAGAIPQDLKYRGEQTSVVIGDDNTIREYVTINLGTQASGKTEIGQGNLIMAYAHIAHDCVIGDGCIVANNGTLAGHVIMEDQAIIGGLSAVHQFVRIGQMAIVGGCSKVVQDVPPFSTCDGHPARCYGINAEGLRRRGMTREIRAHLKQAFRILCNEGLTIPHALDQIERQVDTCPEVAALVAFIRASHRGICR